MQLRRNRQPATNEQTRCQCRTSVPPIIRALSPAENRFNSLLNVDGIALMLRRRLPMSLLLPPYWCTSSSSALAPSIRSKWSCTLRLAALAPPTVLPLASHGDKLLPVSNNNANRMMDGDIVVIAVVVGRRVTIIVLDLQM